ncbi:hypothetical protein BD309DRAFT_914660 [Dichomitus squalens]|nr:hypothetical protein BD309DRAFT_914660 [Dichomitus squalens]
MEYDNALGLTFRNEPTVLSASEVDWDSVTVVSLQSIPDFDHKLLSFPARFCALGRWSAGAPRRIGSSAWRRAGLVWRTSMRSLRRRFSPTLQYASTASIFPNLTGIAPTNATATPNRAGIAPRRPTAPQHPVFSVAVSTYQCVACQSSIGLMHDDAILAPCGHQYHIECLLSLVETSLQTLSSFPPRCCRQIIPQDVFDRYLTRAQRAAYTSRQTEHDTPKRVYCANPRCSRFLGPRDKRVPVRVLACPAHGCGTRTCARCKARVDPRLPAHKHECSHDPGHRATLRLGSQLGWVRCPTCEELIERHGGCAHMTCVCGAQFCYRCRALWKTCNCVDWGDGVGADAHEARLFEPLEDVGNIAAQLALWTPATLERNGNGSGDASRGGAEESAPAARPARIRPRSRTLPPNEALRAFVPQATSSPSRPPSTSLSPMAASSSKVLSPAHRAQTIRSQSFQTVSEVGVCFPFFVDPHIIARGVRAQEARGRTRAFSF